MCLETLGSCQHTAGRLTTLPNWPERSDPRSSDISQKLDKLATAKTETLAMQVSDLVARALAPVSCFVSYKASLDLGLWRAHAHALSLAV